MNILLFFIYLFLAIETIRLAWRLLGPWLVKSAVKRMAKQVQDDYVRNQNTYQAKYADNQEVWLTPNTVLKMPTATQQEKNPFARAKDVDFEDVS